MTSIIHSIINQPLTKKRKTRHPVAGQKEMPIRWYVLEKRHHIQKNVLNQQILTQIKFAL